VPDEKLHWVTFEGHEAIWYERGVMQEGGAHLRGDRCPPKARIGADIEKRLTIQSRLSGLK